MKSTLTSTSDSPTIGRFLFGPSTTTTFRFGKRIRRYAAASCPVAPPPITNTSFVTGFLVSIGISVLVLPPAANLHPCLRKRTLCWVSVQGLFTDQRASSSAPGESHNRNFGLE